MPEPTRRPLWDRGWVPFAFFALAAVLMAAFAWAKLRPPGEVTFEYDASDPHDFSREERRAIEDVAERTIPDVRRVLPGLPKTIVVRVRTDTHVMPETGENGTTVQPNIVDWQVDASRPGGVAAIARAQLHPTLFHELHHLVRCAVLPCSVSDKTTTLKDRVITEGLATAFERDFGGASPAWGQYPGNVAEWAKEILALPDDSPRDPWMFWHPDGRRWIGFRVGTWIVDCAMKATGKTSADLVRVPAGDVIAMCPEPALR